MKEGKNKTNGKQTVSGYADEYIANLQRGSLPIYVRIEQYLDTSMGT